MNTDLAHLSRMNDALAACRQGALSIPEMVRQWRNGATHLPLPEKYGVVLGQVLDRIEASALFSEESCSFSQKDLLHNLQLWADKAKEQLQRPLP